MASQLALYRAAAGIIKHRPPDSLVEDTEIVNLLNLEYANVIAFCLEQGLWNFALRAIALGASVDVEPSFGYTYAFERPDDFVRLNAISHNEMFYPTIEAYVIEGEYWFAFCNPLFVSYLSNGTSFGNNLGSWPASYQRYVEYELACRVAPHLTAMNIQELGQLDKMRRNAMDNAKANDALEQPAQRPPPGRLVTARYGSRGWGQTPWWR